MNRQTGRYARTDLGMETNRGHTDSQEKYATKSTVAVKGELWCLEHSNQKLYKLMERD